MLLQIRLPGLRDALDSLRSRRDEPTQEEPALRLGSLAQALEEGPPPLEEPPAAARDAMPRPPPVRRDGVLPSLQGLPPQTPEEQAGLDRINAEKRLEELGPTVDRYVAEQRVVRPSLEPSTPAERAETDRLIGPVPVGIEGPSSIPPSDPARRGTIAPSPEPGMGRRLGGRFLAGIAKVNPIVGEYARSHLDLPETGKARRERLEQRAEAGSLTFEDEADVAETFRDPGGVAGQVGEFAGELVGDPASVLLPFGAGERVAAKGLEAAARRGVPGVGRFLRASTVDPDASLARRVGQRALSRTGTFGTGAAAAEIPHRLREEGRLPTPGELGTAFAFGTATGPLFGAGEELAITGARAAGRAMSDVAAARELGVPRNASEDVARRAFLDRYTRDFRRWEGARPGTEESAAAFNDAQRAAVAFERLRRRGGWRGRREPVPESEIPGPRPPEPDRPVAPPSRQLEGPRAEPPASGTVAPRPPAPSEPAPRPAEAPVRPVAEAPARPLEGPAPAREVPEVVRPDMPTSEEAGIEVEAMELADLGRAEYDARRELLEVAGDERASAILRRAEEIRYENQFGPEINQFAPEETGEGQRAIDESIGPDTTPERGLGSTDDGSREIDRIAAAGGMDPDAPIDPEALARLIRDADPEVSGRDVLRAYGFPEAVLDLVPDQALLLDPGLLRTPRDVFEALVYDLHVPPEDLIAAMRTPDTPRLEGPAPQAPPGYAPAVWRYHYDRLIEEGNSPEEAARLATFEIDTGVEPADPAGKPPQPRPGVDEEPAGLEGPEPPLEAVPTEDKAEFVDKFYEWWNETPFDLRMADEGLDWLNCTSCAAVARRMFGGEIMGYGGDVNLGARVGRVRAGEESELRPGGGHDFLVVDDRYIIDPWAVNEGYEPILDMQAEPEKARELYGDPAEWEAVGGGFEPVPHPDPDLQAESAAKIRAGLEGPAPREAASAETPEELAALVPEAIEIDGRPAVMRGPDGVIYATVRAGDIIRDPERIQFKRVGSEGVTQRLPGEYSPHLAGAVDVTRLTGETGMFLENGFHRHLKALEAGEDTPIPVRIHPESTPEQARRRGALMNIGEGHATPTDAAKLIREEGLTTETLVDANIDLRKDVARLGVQLAKLPDDIFTRVATGDLTERMGAAIGDSGLSEAGMRGLEKLVRDQPDMTIQQVRELARFVEGAGETTASQETLFGTEELTRSNALEKAKLSASVKRRLARDRSLFGYVSRPGRAERLEQAGAGEIEIEKARDLAESAAGLEEMYTKLSTVTGPVSDALNAAAAELAAGGSEREILDRLYDDVVVAIKSDPDARRVTGTEDPDQQSLLAERSPQYGPPGRDMLEGPVEQWDPDPAKVRAAFETFGRSQHNVTFDEVLDYLPEAAAKKPWDTAVAGRTREDRIRRGEPPMSKEQHAVAQAISDLSRAKGLELRTLDEQARALEGPEGVMDALRTGDETVGAGLDPSLFKKLGANLYREDITAVAFKEGIQNAVDATRGQPNARIEIEADTQAREITIRDNGEGMTPDVAANEFMDVGGSAKREGASGGYGLAKVGLLAHAEHFKLETTLADGTMTTIEGTSDDWVNGSLSYRVQRGMAVEQGTELTIKFEEESNPDWYAGFDFLEKFLRFDQSGTDVSVTRDGNPWPAGGADAKRFQGSGNRTTVTVPGAQVVFEPSADMAKSQSMSLAILNNGLYQFKSGHWFTDEGQYPTTLVVDVRPTVNPDHADYPFTTNREAYKAEVERAVRDYTNNIKDIAARQRLGILMDALNSAARMPGGTGVYATSGTVTKPTLERVARSSYAEPLTNVMKATAEAIFDRLSTTGRYVNLIDEFEFGGIGISESYLGVNIRRAGLEAIRKQLPDPGYDPLPDTNLILINPYGHLHEANAYAEDVTPRALAEQTWSTILHEIAHQLASGHNEQFAGVLTRILGAMTDIQARYVADLEGVWDLALSSGIREDLAVIEGEWHGENIFESIADHTRGDDLGGTDADVRPERPAGSGPARREGRDLDAGGVREAPGGRQEGPRRRGAPVRGTDADVVPRLEGPQGVRERPADERAEALRDRLDEIDRITEAEGRDETPEEVEEIMRILDELNDIAPSGPTYDAPISVPRQPGDSGEVGEAQGEYEALRRRFTAAFKHPDTGDIIRGATHITAARGHPDEMRLLDEWDRETSNVGFVDQGGTFYTRAEAERMLPPEVPPESQAIANYRRQNAFGRGRGEVREGDQPDMFGADLRGRQEDLGLGPTRGLRGPSPPESGQLEASERLARSTVERLRPVVEAGEATPEQRAEYRQAIALLRRNDALSADEARLLADPEAPADTESGDLFGGLEGPSGVREPDPGQGDIFHDNVTWGGPQQAQAARQKIIEENKGILRALAPETRLRLVGEAEAKLQENLNIDLTSRALTIRKPQDVAPFAALFRSPSREILQAFLFGDEVNGKRQMLGHMLVTTGEINSAGFSKQQVADLLDMIENTGATAVMLAHNHPSSDPTPSPEDRGITATVAAGLRGNGIEPLGHIVVNHGIAVVMSGNDPWIDNTITYDPDGLVDWRMPVGRAKSPQDVAIMAGKTAGKDGFTILYADAQNQPVALEMHPNSDVALFDDRGWLDGRMGELAASQVFIVIDEGNPLHDSVRDDILAAYRKTVMGVGPVAGLRDVVSVNGDKWSASAVLDGKLGQRQGGYLGTPQRLLEGPGEYGTGDSTIDDDISRLEGRASIYEAQQGTVSLSAEDAAAIQRIARAQREGRLTPEQEAAWRRVRNPDIPPLPEGLRGLEGPQRFHEGEGGYGGGVPPEGPPAPPAAGGEPPERPGRLRGVETGPYSADDFLRTKLGETGLDPETERIFRAEFERATAATGTTRRRVSDEEVRAMAAQIGQDPAAVHQVLDGRGLDAAEQLALLAVARSNTQRMAEALRRIGQDSGEGGGKLREHERLDLEREIERRAELNNVLLSKWAEEGSEAGRTLRARRLEAFAIDDEFAVLGLAQRLKSRAGGRAKDLTVDEQNRILGAVETGNKAQLAEYLTSLDKQSPISKFFAVIKAAMLSLVQTHMVNLTSNAIKFTAGPTERFYASLADRPIARQREKITGETFARTTMVGRGDVEGTKAFRQSVPKAGQAWWYSVSGKVPEQMSEEVIDALRRATSHRTDVRRRIELTDPNKAKTRQPGRASVEIFTNGILGALGAGDILFRHPAYVRSLWEQAGIHARREGLEPGTPEFTARVKKLLEDPTGAMERQAQLDSDESVFMDPTGFFDGVDDIIQKIKRGETMMGRPGQAIAESLAPFTRTLLGIADQTSDLTGLGILRGSFNAGRMIRYLKEEAARPDRQMALGQDPETVFDPNNPKDAEFLARLDAAQKRAAKQIGRGMLGATSFVLIAALGGYLAMRDRIKTRYPTNARERELWRAQDIRPNSILINGKWRQTDFLGPYGLALMIGAYVHDIATSEEDQRDSILSESIRFATSFAESMMRVIGAVTIAQGLETVSELTAGEEGSFEDYFRSIARMPYPNIMRGVARSIDPVRREADWRNVTDQYGVSTPGISQTYPPRVDMLGRDIVGPEGVWANIFSPSRGAREDRRLTDPMLHELDRLGTAPIRPRRSDVEGWASAAGIGEITGDQWYRIQKRYGETMADITRSLINSPEYQESDDEAKRARLEQLWTAAKTRLNRELRGDMSERGEQAQPRLEGPRPAVGAP